MYSIQLQNGAIVGTMTLASAMMKLRNNVVVVAIIRKSDNKKVR